MKNKINLLIIVALSIGIGFACSGSFGDQTEEANKLVKEANKKIDDAKDLSEKTEKRNTALFTADVKDIKKYKAEKEDEAKDLIKSYEKLGDLAKSAAKDFSDASKMKVNEKIKEYWETKAKEFEKRSEIMTVFKANPQVFLDLDDTAAMSKRFKENNAKADSLLKEAQEFAAKADKIQADNKDIFKDL